MNVMVCLCKDYHRMDSRRLEELFLAMDDRNLAYNKVDDLCSCSVFSPEKVAEANVLIGCNSRAVSALARYAGAEDLPRIYGLDKYEAEEIIDELCSLDKERSGIVTYEKSKENWIAWFPVIDGERCVQCGECFDFCMFGTYQKENGKVRVIEPSACKTDCPACARICPENAIIFPKSREEHLNGSLDTKRIPDKEVVSSLQAKLEKRKAQKLFKDDKD